jgi:nitroreductase
VALPRCSLTGDVAKNLPKLLARLDSERTLPADGLRYNRDEAWVVRSIDGYNSIETDLTIAMDNLVLAATYEGVGTCWIAAFAPDILREALQLKPNEEIFAFTPLGYAASDAVALPKRRKSLGEIVTLW